MESTTTTTAQDGPFTVDVTPRFEGLEPRFDVSVSNLWGPLRDEQTVGTLPEVDQLLLTWGFRRTGEFGQVCDNGFATAPVTKVPDFVDPAMRDLPQPAAFNR